jgi:hypothetical protein
MRLISISWLRKFIGSDAAHPGPIANDLEDEAVMFVDRVAQDGVLPREQGGQLIGIMLRQFSAAFDVGEEKGDGASGKVGHAYPRLRRYKKYEPERDQVKQIDRTTFGLIHSSFSLPPSSFFCAARI